MLPLSVNLIQSLMQNGLGIGSSKDLGGAELDFKP